MEVPSSIVARATIRKPSIAIMSEVKSKVLFTVVGDKYKSGIADEIYAETDIVFPDFFSAGILFKK